MRRRFLVAVVLLAAVVLLGGACSPRSGGGGTRATPTPATKVVDAPIESIDILVRESFPPGYTAHIVSGLPSGCAKFNMATVVERTGNHIAVKVTNTMPADPHAACTAIYGYKETNLDLGTNFTSGQTYTVDVNDKSKSFTAQSAAPPPSPTASLSHGEFVPIAGLQAARALHATVVLKDGSVLILGGNRAGGGSPPVLASVERYDPATRSFSAAGNLVEPRQTFTAVLLADGKVLAAGGVGNNSSLSSAELFDPATGTSVAVGSLSAPRAGYAAALLPDGRVLLMGGGPSPVGTTEIYDPATKSFSPGPAMAFARANPRAISLRDGSVLVVSDGSAERFDPGRGTFATVIPQGALEVPSLLNDGRVLFTGGPDLSPAAATPTAMEGTIRPATTAAALFDPGTGGLTPTGSMHDSRLLHEAVTLPDGRVLVAGGAQTTHFDGDFRGSAEVYDSRTGTFTLTGSMRSGRVWFSLVALSDGSVLAVGDNGGNPNSAELWRP